MSHEILKHTADVKLQVTGRDLAELLREALSGMNEILQPVARDSGRGTLPRAHIIEIASIDQSALIIDFLSEVLSLSQIEKVVWDEIKIINLNENTLKAELVGREIEEFGDDIKAVTYHGAEVVRNKNGLLEITILFDI